MPPMFDTNTNVRRSGDSHGSSWAPPVIWKSVTGTGADHGAPIAVRVEV